MIYIKRRYAQRWPLFTILFIFLIVNNQSIDYYIGMSTINMLRFFLISFIILGIFSAPVPSTVGFQIGQITGYKLLNQSGSSKLYQIECPQIQDGRPMKLLQLVGTHHDVGFDYATLLGQQIVSTYNIFMEAGFSNPIQRHILQMFLDWQYDNFIYKKIPAEFNQELRGIQNGGFKSHNLSRLRTLIQRVLVVSSYPGDFGSDIIYAMVDAFLQQELKIKNPKILNYVQNNLFSVVKFIKHFMNKKRIHCSFMATWGSKTKGGKLYTMRNLDWQANTGINNNKIIFVWKIKGTIPHTTIGYPGIIGALTGMSQAGLTVHQAGLDSMKQTELGFQWTLRLRYILMNAHNLKQAKNIWQSTENTFGMNHMVASAADVATNEPPIFVVETMRDYTAWFTDNDPREDGVNFTDPSTKKPFRAGYAMKDAVFRTNHAYDPTINKWVTKHISEKVSTFHRYIVLKDSLAYYGKNEIGELEALNITANVAHKGGPNLYQCPQAGKDNGTNVISVMFVPGESRMYAAIEYGSGDSYKTACCGVYLNIDLSTWFNKKEEEQSEREDITVTE